MKAAAFRVTGDFSRMTYSEHASERAAVSAARSLSRKWGQTHLGSEPRVEKLTEGGWEDIGGFNAGRAL